MDPSSLLDSAPWEIPIRWNLLHDSHCGKSHACSSSLLLSAQCQAAEVFLQTLSSLLKSLSGPGGDAPSLHWATQDFLTLEMALLLVLASQKNGRSSAGPVSCPSCLRFAPGMVKASLHLRVGYVSARLHYGQLSSLTAGLLPSTPQVAGAEDCICCAQFRLSEIVHGGKGKRIPLLGPSPWEEFNEAKCDVNSFSSLCQTAAAQMRVVPMSKLSNCYVCFVFKKHLLDLKNTLSTATRSPYIDPKYINHFTTISSKAGVAWCQNDYAGILFSFPCQAPARGQQDAGFPLKANRMASSADLRSEFEQPTWLQPECHGTTNATRLWSDTVSQLLAYHQYALYLLLSHSCKMMDNADPAIPK